MNDTLFFNIFYHTCTGHDVHQLQFQLNQLDNPTDPQDVRILPLTNIIIILIVVIVSITSSLLNCHCFVNTIVNVIFTST